MIKKLIDKFLGWLNGTPITDKLELNHPDGKPLMMIDLQPNFNDFTQAVVYQELEEKIENLSIKNKINLREFLQGIEGML